MPAEPSAAQATYGVVGAFFDGLVDAGVRHVCVSPGSRSTPLAVAADRQPDLRVFTHIDERSGAFFALGLAKASRAPVALVCTSGTAAANWLPAVIEAHYARVPLVLLTADRPPELREWGAGQTIDQVHLYGRHVRWYTELPVPEAWGPPGGGSEPVRLRHARALAARAVAESLGTSPGPVHCNWPLREPLEPPRAPAASDEPVSRRATARVHRTLASPSVADIDALQDLVHDCERGLIAVGPLDAEPGLADAIAELAHRAGWPVLADPTSQLRWGPHTVDAPIASTLDFVLRDAVFANGHPPDVVLRFGATPVCKSFRLWIERQPPDHLVLVDPGGGWEDPSHLATRVLRCDPQALCRAVTNRLQARGEAAGNEVGLEPTARPETADGSAARRDAGRESAWSADFRHAERAARAAIEAGSRAEPLLEPEVVSELADFLPDGATLYVSNSMPVRDLDAFLPVDPRRLRVLANRGASGIDGVTSSALGAAAASDGPVFLLTGDLAFLHDLGALLTARRTGLRVVVIVLNNDGGGIFSFLPIAAHGEEASFEALFRTPHGLELAPAARAFGLEVARADSRASLRAALEKASGAAGSFVIEVPIDRDANVAHYRDLVAQVGHALSRDRGDGAA